MTNTFRAGLLVAVGLTLTQPAAAQDRPLVSLLPDNLPRWDASGHVGWLGVNKSKTAPDWNDWYDTGSLGTTVGFYRTRHLKIELDASTTVEAGLYVQEEIVVAGEPAILVGERRFRSHSAGGGFVYQFLENAWLHPFLGAGIDVTREATHAQLRQQVLCVRAPCLPSISLPAESSVAFMTRPFAMGGFKWYVSERAFIRIDLRSSFSADGAATVVWRSGIGVDF